MRALAVQLSSGCRYWTMICGPTRTLTPSCSTTAVHG